MSRYLRRENRLATVKLTEGEWLSLITRLLLDIDRDAAERALERALGVERARAMIDHKVDPRLTKRDNHAIVREMYPLVPGKTDAEKEAYLINMARDVWPDNARFAQIVDMVRDRIGEFQDAGGTLDKYPEPPPKPDHVIYRITQWWGGVNMSGATVDPDYALTVSAAGRDWSDAPASWRAGHAGPGSGEDAVGCCCCAYQRSDGSWAGGKYEWHVRPPRRRSYENIKAGYNGWEAPRSGTPIVLWVHTADGNRVSEQVETTWP
jgi:hypothetical protein